MMRNFLSAFIFLSFLGAAYAGDIAKEVVSPTVQIDRDCSGTLVHSKRNDVTGDVRTVVLTAKHCTRAVGQAIEVNTFVYDDDVRQVKEVTLKSTVAGQHFKYDLALLELADKDTLYTNIATVAPKDYKPLRYGDVVAVGYPMGMAIVPTKGLFLERITDARFPYKEEVFMANVAIAGGSSGGGLYAEVDGKYSLIGVTSMGATQFDFALFVPVNHVKEYLDIALK